MKIREGGGGVTFLTSRVSMQRSMRSTVEMSMCSLHMSFIHLVKLSTMVRNSTQVNLMMLKTRLRMLSMKAQGNGRVHSTTVPVYVFVPAQSPPLVLCYDDALLYAGKVEQVALQKCPDPCGGNQAVKLF